MVDVHGYVRTHILWPGLREVSKAIWVTTYTRGLLRCSFNITGQCEGLEEWNEQQVSAPRFSYY